MSRRRLSIVAAAAACLAVGLLVPARGATTASGVTKQTYQVPVTQPDEYGRPVTIDTDVYLRALVRALNPPAEPLNVLRNRPVRPAR